ncbi:MAG: metallophosphoesterase family protein [Candidatus Woesearchaeota archaeon]
MKIAVISDIHSNIEALEAVLREIDRLKIKHIFCCGDVVGFNASPHEVIALLQERKIPCVQGNQDLVAATLHRLKWFNPDARAAILWTHKQLSKEEKKWLLKLPLKFHNKEITMWHGSEKDLFEGLYPDYLSQVKMPKTRMLFTGHIHAPFAREINGVLVVNPGSVGQPHDKDARASFAIVDTGTYTVSIKRVSYDIDATAEKINKAGLPTSLAKRLYKGV